MTQTREFRFEVVLKDAVWWVHEDGLTVWGIGPFTTAWGARWAARRWARKMARKEWLAAKNKFTYEVRVP